ncbi:MAG: AbrB/MazE/SpoVT family DNA-binding domain-containing protein [Candidatus Methylomirabilis sp.]|nr:AbrB/MazE/SpoVT family DNA-binding domain-containing protein [Deltaproteobacteria bacterium]
MPKGTYNAAAGSVNLPPKIAKALKLAEGDELEVHLQESGAVLMMPRKAIPKGQEWFWTPAHQAREREADEDVRLGRVGPVLKTPEEVRDYFAKRMKPLPVKKKAAKQSKRRA